MDLILIERSIIKIKMKLHIVIFVITKNLDLRIDSKIVVIRNLTQNSDNRKALAERLLKGVDIDEHPEKKMLQRIDKLNILIENETIKLEINGNSKKDGFLIEHK